jgi:endo-1,4-beta-xylanase
MRKPLTIVAFVVLFGYSVFPQTPERIVYPHALIGPFQGATFQIELRLTNKNAFKEWTGMVRMLRSQDLSAMTGIESTDQPTVPLIDGQLNVQLGPNRSSYFKLTSATPQAGILVIESGASSIGDLLPSFWYRVVDGFSGKATDLVSVQPASSPSTVSSIVAARVDGIDVGIAILAERAFEGAGTLSTPIPLTVTAILEDGAEITGATTLGGMDGEKKAFFAGEILPEHPANVRVERLLVSSPEKFYAFAGAIGSPPQFATLQIGPIQTVPESTRNVALRVLGRARGLRLGAAVQARLLGESDYARTLARDFDMVTPENDMKFGPVHPGPATYNFTNADAIVDFALSHGMQVKGHTLVWHQQLPAWLTNRSWTRDELIAVLRDHITTVVGRYKGRVSYWDVVNEAIDDSGNLRNTIWLQMIGPEYIEMAFQWAHEADPNAKLIYNDYGTEGLGRKSDAVYALVRGLVQKGVPVQGVGLQGHFTLSSSPRLEDVSANLARLAALGLDAYFSELDIRIQRPASDIQLSDQAALYGSIAAACVSSPNCRAIGLWGFTDKYSWIPSAYPGFGDALIFDTQYLPKPAYLSLSDALAK